MPSKINPLGDNVLVKVQKQEKKTKSGLVLPDTTDEKPQIGEVVAVGDDNEKIKVKVGQNIIFAKYTGTEIKLDNEEYLILKSEDVLAIVE